MKAKFYMLLTVLLGTFASTAMAEDVVYNATTQTGYSTLGDALNDLDVTAAENVLELNGDVTLDGRTAPVSGKTLTLKPTKDGITIRRGKLATTSTWFLTNNANQTLNIGCDEHQLVIDGEEQTYSKAHLLGCEKGTMNVTNVKFTNFKYGTDARLNDTKTSSAKLTLKNITVENSETGIQFFVCKYNDALTLDGSLNFNNCTGKHISVQARFALKNATQFTVSTPVTLDISSSLHAANKLVVKCDKASNTAAACFVDAANQYYIVKNPTKGHEYELILSTTSGIGNVTTATQSKASEYFDLQGRRVANPTKGIYIVNHKKVVIK